MNRARTLFDPRNEMLKDVFVDEPNAFPTGEFAEPAWLDLLVDVGLKTRLDRDTILACATKVMQVLDMVAHAFDDGFACN